MKTLVLIDDDALFMHRVAYHFRNIRVLLPRDEKNPCPSAIDLVKKNPGAHFWIDVLTRHHLTGDVSRAGVELAAWLIGDMQIKPEIVRLCGNQPEQQLPEDLRDRMRNLGVAYVDKVQAIRTIEELFGPAGEPEQSKASDLQWALRVLGRKKKYKEYVGKVVAVYRHQVLASGPDLLAAIKDAQGREGCPAVDELTFARVRPDTKDRSLSLQLRFG